MPKFSFNIKQFEIEMSKGSNRRVMEAAIFPLVQEILLAEMEVLKENFESHPVTREIDAGPNAHNISGTLNGTGNLFTFIGFERGSKPLDAIRAELNKDPVLVSVKYNRGRVSGTFRGPSKNDLFKVTPLPWATDSWARRIEKGLAGFGQYLLKGGAGSRSGGAIQVNNKVRTGRFKNRSYISRMLSDFYKSI